MEVIFLVLLALLASAFFSGIEIAFLSANKLMLQLSKEKRGAKGKILEKITASGPQFIGTTLIGNNISLVLLGMGIALIIAPTPPIPLDRLVLIPDTGSDFYNMMIQTAITTVVVLIFGEFIPKNLFRQKPSRILRFFTFPLAIIYALLYPFVWLILKLVNGMLKLFFKLDVDEGPGLFSRLDLQHIVDFSHNEEEPETDLNKEIFENALHLKDIKVRECMVPRPEIDAFESGLGFEALLNCFSTSKRSRVLVYSNDIDNVLGYVHHFDLINGKRDLPSMIHPLPVVPESMKAQDVLDELIKKRKNMALVVDEFGGTAGIITMEDILEEIFGEIQDEHDDEDLVNEQLSDFQFILSGRLEVDSLNEMYEINFPTGDFETLSGFILEHHEKIPDQGELIEIGPFVFKILRVSQTKIETVRLDIPTRDKEPI